VSIDLPVREGAQPRLWAEEIPVRGDLRAASRFPAADYADNFEITVPAAERTAEQWARAVFEEAAPHVQRMLVSGWRVIGLQLGPQRSAQHVLGWRIVKNSPGVIVLQARSLAGFTVRLVLQPGDSCVRFGTFVRCDGLAARAVCFGVAPIHRLVISRLLGDIAR
jgi:hypothetical protein